MKTNIEIWTVNELYEQIDDINEQPKYQRGAVWKDPKKSLLIDSILRGVDIPKIYLNKKKSGAYKFEVADGQQRIDALKKFKDDDLELRGDVVGGLNLNRISSLTVGGLKYSDLPLTIKQKLDDYKLTIAVIENASNQEIRTLFGRLQLGETLKPAEKRNALISGIGTQIDNISLNHQFFDNSRIKRERFGRQDYIAHALTLVAYNNSSDLKAALIEKMYLDRSFQWSESIITKATDILDLMKGIDDNSRIRIINKFSFIDIFWFLYLEFQNFSHIDIKGFSKKYDDFEKDRRFNYKSPKELLAKGTRYSEDLYRYIMAYRYEGAKTKSIKTRNEIFTKEFRKYLK